MNEAGLRHPGRWLWLLVLVPVLLGLSRLRFDVEVFDLLPPELPAVEGLKLYQQHFANARELILALKAADSETAETAARAVAQALRARTNLVATVTWEPPWIESPGLAAELIAYLWYNQPPEKFRGLADSLAPAKLDGRLAATREELSTTLSPAEIPRLAYDPLGLTRLPETAAGTLPAMNQGHEIFSLGDGSRRVLFIQAAGELRTYKDCDEWLRQIKPIVRAAAESASAAGASIVTGYTGRPAFVAEIALGMQRDITLSVTGTALIIAVLFWLAHRRVKPMLWLLALLVVVLGATLGLGGLFFGLINVVSLGFAAILLGLAVDYAVVHYQEALAQPELTIPQVRRAIAPSIFWAAVTTISAFLALNLGGLPGLAQLGTLVGLGVGLAACIMIFEFLPPLFPERRGDKPPGKSSASKAPTPTAELAGSAGNPSGFRGAVLLLPQRAALALTVVLLAWASTLLWFGPPPIDPTADPLRPRHSPAYGTLAELQTFWNQGREPLWLIVAGNSEARVAEQLRQAEPTLATGVSNQLVAAFTLPTSLWPRPEFQERNRVTAQVLAGQKEAFRRAAQTNGFAPESLGLAEAVLTTWDQASRTPGAFWPTNRMSRWLFEKFSARTGTNLLAIGLLYPETNSPALAYPRLAQLEQRLPRDQAWISGWGLLGDVVFSRVKQNLWKVLVPMVCLVLLSLGLAFRRWREILLSLAALLLSGFCLLAVMHAAGWSWNLLNLMALPLVLGTGVDYSIFMQLALRRHGGDLTMGYRSVGRALLLCGGTAVAGFGSLALSSNAGMASLGQVCAAGIGLNMLIAVFLLPHWWCRVGTRDAGERALALDAQLRQADPPLRALSGSLAASAGSHPSLYRAGLWRLGMLFVRTVPAWALRRLCVAISGIHFLADRRRRDIVIANLLPAVGGDRLAAYATARRLYCNFALKLVELWRVESGVRAHNFIVEPAELEMIHAARRRGRGVLFLTAHLGNWEHGGLLLAQHGIPLTVLTLAEPDSALTELRSASRARWGIDTLVIGQDHFALVEVIKRLDAGAALAIAIDRPAKQGAVLTELLGRPFSGTLAAAELARASGCALFGVTILRRREGYEVKVLPEIMYDRRALGTREARWELTRRILMAFEPGIRRDPDQWYQFVPIWPGNT